MNDLPIIRDSQKAAFESAALDEFARECLPVVERNWPSRCRESSRADLLEAVASSLRRARSFGIVGRLSMLEYLDLAMLLGHDFPDRPELAWARQILDDAETLQEEKVAAIARRILAQRREAGAGG